MEVRCVLDIFKLGRLDIVLKSAEVILGELLLGMGLETLVKWWDLALVVLGVDGRAGGLGEGSTEEVLRCNLWDVASVAWNVLGFQVLGGSTKPVVTLLGIVSIN